MAMSSSSDGRLLLLPLLPLISFSQFGTQMNVCSLCVCARQAETNAIEMIRNSSCCCLAKMNTTTLTFDEFVCFSTFFEVYFSFSLSL